MALIVVAVCDRFGQMTKEENCRDGAACQWMCSDKTQSPENPAGQWFSPWVKFLVLARKSSAARAEMPLYLECWTPRGQALSSGHAAKTRALWKVCGEQGDLSGHCLLSMNQTNFCLHTTHFLLNLHANAKSTTNFSACFCKVISVFSNCIPELFDLVRTWNQSPLGLCVFSIIFYLAVLWLKQV